MPRRLFTGTLSNIKSNIHIPWQRVGVLFLLTLFFTSAMVPSVAAITADELQQRQLEAIQKSQAQADSHIKPITDEANTKPDTFNYPGAMPVSESKNKPASDYSPKVETGIPGVVKGQGKQPAVPGLQPVPEKTFKEGEIVEKRTAKSSTFRNKDGSLTVKKYYAPKFFKKDGKWATIDNALIEDKNAGDSGNVAGRALGAVESWFKEETTFIVKDNDWQSRFAPSNAPQGMVRIKLGSSQMGFSPVGAADVKPVITTDAKGAQTVHYYNLWPGVDVEYAVQSAGLKENIVLKGKNSTADFAFKLLGGSLERTTPDESGIFGYRIKGALNEEFGIAPLAIMLNKYGFEARQPLAQSIRGDQLNVSVDRDFLEGLPDDAYPVVVDPTVVHQNHFGTRVGGNYAAFKSDGYVCDSTICNPYAGSVLDSQGVWRSWRGLLFSDYSEIKGKQLDNASLHLTQRLGLSVSGTTAAKNFKAWHATCFSYSCLGVGSSTVSIGTVGDIDVTSVYQSRINANDWGAWLMITGEETTSTTYKNWDPDNSWVQFTFTDVLPSPAIVTPVEGQVYIDPQVAFSSTTHTNPSSGAALQYVFCVSTSTGCNGAVMVSAKQTAPQWTIPDGVLQEGNTYYVQAQTYDPAIDVTSAWGVPNSFKIDPRTGKDTTQAYDAVGPVSVDLATGNLTTGAASHSSNALGGSMGVSLDYNSPVRSRYGLVGKYWNLANNAPDTLPTTTPVLTRVDQSIDFNWNTGSPDGLVQSDWFYAQWTGYFVAPSTGTYYFGGKHDDLLRITINSQLLYDSGGCYSTPCYATTGITLNAGQVVPVDIQYKENTSPAYTTVMVKGAVTEGPLKNEWLQTGVREPSQLRGLTGRYYKDNGNHDFTDSSNTMLMQRTDPTISFDWGANEAVPGGPRDGYMIRWNGYFTAPVAGTYDFGTKADDGTRIYLNGSSTPSMNNWSGGAYGAIYGTGIYLTAGQTIPITVDYFEVTAGAYMYLMVKNAVAEQIVPAAWLSYTSKVLPTGWNLGLDADGNTSYDRINITANAAVLNDSTGSTHEYKWDAGKKAYTPPVNEDGNLVRNDDATYTLQDSDGRTYVFNTDGTVQSVTNPVDDAQPAALQYTYGGTPSKLTQITDGVTSGRWMQVYYSGDSNCVTPPATFDTAAPAGMLCAVKTNDGRITSFFYKSSKLARIAKPGNEIIEYGYDTLGRIVSVRSSIAMDAVGASVRADDATANTEVTYDDIGRATKVKLPAATSGASRIEHTLSYLPGNGTYFGATEQHVTGASEPNGFTHRIEYDKLLRTTKDTDITNLSDVTKWDTYKDLILSTTDRTGLMSTTIYDNEDRAMTQYGPAPSSWYDATTRLPLSTYTSQVPRTDTGFDEGMQGPNVTYYTYSSASRALTGAPKLHTTNLSGAPSGQFNKLYTTSPVPGVTSDWGFRATGRIRLSTTGSYNFRIYSDAGVRLYIDDKLELDDWNDGAQRSHPDISYNNTVANSLHRIRVEYYHRTGDANFQLYMTVPSGSETLNVNQYISPDYSLRTSSKAYDGTLGNTTATTNYGSNPELGLAQSSSIDPTGLNLTTSSSYETQGASGSFLRQTAKYLPGANTSTSSTATQYTYYTATDTRDDPCTTGTTEAYKQAGMLKIKTEPDPDGTGTQTGRILETVYDDAGRAVATRYNTESWTCTTYDTRGRVSQTVVPAYGTNAARTVQNDYAVGGSPLVTTTWDGNGWIVVWSDLLGRTTKYRDVYDDETTTTYDNFGRITQKVSPMGTEAFTYDTYGRLVDQKLDTVTYATIHYDSLGRADYIDYPNASQQRVTYGWDTLGRLNSKTYRMGNGTTTISDTVNRTQSGRIQNDIVASGGSDLWYTYGYDAASRLTSASVGANSFSYGFGTQDTTTCGTGNNKNADSGKNSNRTSQTINGTTTYFCYDYADKLNGSNNALYNTPTYDSHGNMTQIGTGTTPLRLYYDSSDRNSGYEQYNSSTTGVGLYYNRDVQGRIIGRYKNTITNGSWAGAGSWFYDYTGSGGSTYARDSGWAIIEKNISLPGGVSLTVKPTQTGNAQKQYSHANIQGSTLLTTDAAGTNTSNGNGPASTFTYDPFGNILTGSNYPSNTATSGSYAWAGKVGKLSETAFALAPISMGARIYLPALGRFTQVDPVEGGALNAYVYVLDPVSSNDYSGQYACAAIDLVCQRLFPTIQTALKPVMPNITQPRAAALPSYGVPAVLSRSTGAVSAPLVITPMKIVSIPSQPAVKAGLGTGVVNPKGISWYGAASSGFSYYSAGQLGGAIFGCIVGAAFTIEFGGIGCGAGTAIGASYGGALGLSVGVYLGGRSSSHADDFDWLPNGFYVK